MQKIALIVAGGSGTRMGSELPKQFIEIGGKPILMHTIIKFSTCDEIVLVLPSSEISNWTVLCKKHQFKIKHIVVEGGDTRFQSVKNGLSHISDNSIVAIHDGVRPFVSSDIIDSSFSVAASNGNAIVSVSPKDSIRQLTEEGSKHVDRRQFRMIQTPQTFQSKLIKKAYEQNESALFTDDASVLEGLGKTIQLIDGDYKNIKITTPEDLLIAESYLGF